MFKVEDLGEVMAIGFVPLFSLGMTVITPGFLQKAEEFWGEGMDEFFLVCLSAHTSGAAWKLLDEHDQKANESSLQTRGRILSSIPFNGKTDGEKFWIITDPGWETTTFLLPEEY